MNSQNKEEKETRNTKAEEKGRNIPGCCPEGVLKTTAGCCEGMGTGGSESMPGMMASCCKHAKRACRWFPLIPLLLSGVACLLGYYLSPVTIRIVWLVVSGTVALAAILGLILAHAMCRA